MTDQHDLDLNPEFSRALALMESGSSVLVTGNAGTGKSTLLRLFLERKRERGDPSRVLITAPTGVAALNVGGSTIHRAFKFQPSVTLQWVKSKKYKGSEILGQIETLVIDEISMVRADLMDAIDAALRRFGHTPTAPFGGVQIILVGDPYQLPPVVRDGELEFIERVYGTPYFFSSTAFQELDCEVVELQRIYRQQDEEFISLLNAIRTGTTDDSVFSRVNERYDPEFSAPADDRWVTLTTTNARAEKENLHNLSHLAGTSTFCTALIQGDVDVGEYPTAETLEFKVGAQIMMLTNDEFWVNGSLAVIDRIDQDSNELGMSVDIRLIEPNLELVEETTHTVFPHTWDIRQPSFRDGKVTYENVGTFTQMPFKLAWAMTIHKSQGKTLSKAIINLERGTFADGQLYVALSRCTSLDGLVMKSEVRKHHVKYEREVERFLERQKIASTPKDHVLFAFIGANYTGLTRYDRLIELAALIETASGELQEVSSLLNPMRDVDASSSHGIRAADVSAAPTLIEAWPVFARQLDQKILVARGLATLQTMIERELEASDYTKQLGLGIDLRATTADQDEMARTALEKAHQARTQFYESDFEDVQAMRFQAGPKSRVFGRIFPRDGRFSIRDVQSGSEDLAYGDALSALCALPTDNDALGEDAQALSVAYGLDAARADEVHKALMESAVNAIGRDQRVSKGESDYLSRVADATSLPIPEFEFDDNDLDATAVLTPGTQVCFTGSAQTADGELLDRSQLEQLALDAGLQTVKSVTKKCGALIAADPASMSGKAKKARDSGVPIFSVEQFLAWVNEPEV